MEPFGWWDHFNEMFYRDRSMMQAAVAGGNKVTPLFDITVDHRFSASVAAMQGMLADSNVNARGNDFDEFATMVANKSVNFADALLKELTS